MTTPFKTKAILVNGVELHYLEQGQGNPVIFIHGGVTDLRTWIADGAFLALLPHHRLQSALPLSHCLGR